MGSNLRRTLAVLIVVATTTIFVLSRFDSDNFRICETTPPKTKRELPQEACKPIPVQDVVPVLLLALVLIWPDLAEFELAGIGRISRRLDEQKETQQEIKETQERMINQLQQIQVSSLTASTVINIGDFTALAAQVDDLRRFGPAPEQRELAAASREEVGPTDDKGALFDRLMDVWRGTLEVWADFGRRLSDPAFAAAAAESEPSAVLGQRDQQLLENVRAAANNFDVDQVRQWYAQLHPQLEAVRGVIREGPQLPVATIREAVVLAERASADLREREVLP